MSKLSLTLTILLITLVVCVTIVFDIIPPIFWSVKEFSNPSYHRILEKEWADKSSDFLLLKLHSIDPMRFGLAAYILGQRKEQKAIGILIKKVRSSYIDNQIHFSACSALAQISPSEAKKVLMGIVEQHQNSKNNTTHEHNSPAYKRYENALRILATMKDERIYPICLKMAKSGDRLEKELSLNGMLYRFNNHSEEILPLYIAYLNVRESPKGQTIKALINLEKVEAIPALEEFALKNKTYEKDANDAILYLKGLQK